MKIALLVFQLDNTYVCLVISHAVLVSYYHAVLCYVFVIACENSKKLKKELDVVVYTNWRLGFVFLKKQPV